MRRLLASLIILAVAILPRLVSGQSETTSTPIPEMPGVVRSVARIFVRSDGPRPDETYFLAMNVTEFEAAAITDPATSDVFAKIQDHFEEYAGYELAQWLLLGGVSQETLAGVGEFRETSAPLIGNFTRASTLVSSDGNLNLARLGAGWFCGDNFCVTSMIAGGLQSDGLADLVEVMTQLHQSRSDERTPMKAEYRRDGTWAELPGFEHLPTGFVFEREWVVVGPDEATPLAGQQE